MNFKDRMNAAELLMGGLAYAFYWLDESLQQSMEASGYQRVNRTQSMLVIYASAGVVRPSALARALGISRQAVHQALRDMQGILELRPDPKDKRAKVVSFCDDAENLQRAAADILLEIEKELSRRIGEQKVNQLKTALVEDWGSVVRIDLRRRAQK